MGLVYGTVGSMEFQKGDNSRGKKFKKNTCW